MHRRVQCLDPPAHDFWKPGHLLDADNLEAGLRERVGGAPGGDDFPPEFGQARRERSYPPFIRN